MLISVALLVAPTLAHAQDADIQADAGPSSADAGAEPESADAGAPAVEPARPAPSVIEPVPDAAIGRRIEETFRDLQEATPLLRRQPHYLTANRALPGFTASVTRLSEDPALERLGSLHPASLHDLEQEWSRVAARLLRWQGGLEARSDELAEERQDILEARRMWRHTLNVHRDGDDPLPEAQRDRIQTLLARVRRVKRRLDRRQDEVVGLQGELSDQGLRIAAIIARIHSAQRNARQRRNERDHDPFWLGWGLVEGASEPPSIQDVTAEHDASLRGFLSTERGSLGWHFAFFLVLLGIFVALRLRSRGSDLSRVRHPSAHRALRARPLSSAVLLALVIVPIAYPYVPVVAVGASLVALVPAIVVLSRYLLPVARPPVLALVALSALSVPINLGFVPASIRHALVALIELAAIGVAGWLWWRVWAPQIAAAGPIRRRLYRIIQLAILPLALAFYYNVVGYTERAQIWTAGTLWAIEQAIGLFFATEILRAMITGGLREPAAARVSYTIRKRRRQTVRLLVRTIRWGAVAVFAYLTLLGFDVLDPGLDSARVVLRRSFTFGSIEVSLGDIVVFLAMLVGTFAVMRLVHAILELEILPRLNLEQGIASAISLSVSYVLVAIGVVLAFGSAGVGPERLALLGGALGVGIGFGLQNVVSNFVSGLILVAERPIQVGDVIEIGDLVGEVRRIGIRSSTVRSLDGAEVIVPNADLISGHLVNWTLTDARRRLELTIGTGYQHKPQDVIRILERVVRSQPGVLNDPQADVLCTGFGDSSIDFSIRAWTAGFLDAIQIKSRLALRVYAALEREGIEIPFPQRDLNIRTLPEELSRRLSPEE